ncbi:MAG: hypothetical protein LBC23_02695 [Coriobacteriales bacterium]|nr:hypothetical protein [Coriobacteriales bacterium]
MSGRHSKKSGGKRSLITVSTRVDERAEAKRREIDHIEEDLERVERELLAQAVLDQSIPEGHVEGNEIDAIISSLLGSGNRSSAKPDTKRSAAAPAASAATGAAAPAAPTDPAPTTATPSGVAAAAPKVVSAAAPKVVPKAAPATPATPATTAASAALAAALESTAPAAPVVVPAPAKPVPVKPAKPVKPEKPAKAAKSAVNPLPVAPAAPVVVSLSDSDVAPNAALAATVSTAPVVSAQEAEPAFAAPRESVSAALPEAEPTTAFAPASVTASTSASASTAEFAAPFIIEPPRHRHVWPLIICAAAVFIVATGSITLLTKSFMMDQLEKRTAIQQEANGYLDGSIALIQEADSVIVELDRAVENQIAEEDLPRLEALLDQLVETQSTLDRAIGQATLAQETFLGAEDQELAGHAREAAEYRKQMLDMSMVLVGSDVAAMKAVLDLEYAWTLIVDADANMRSAVEVTAWGAVTDSRDYNQEAVNKLVLAEEALGLAGEVFPQADLTVLTTYLSAKKASAELALASDQAWLDGDYDTAYSKNEEFIGKDAEAVELASAIPSDPLSLIVTAYENLTKQQREDYKAVRSQAAEADAFLRAYLGVDIRQEESATSAE